MWWSHHLDLPSWNPLSILALSAFINNRWKKQNPILSRHPSQSIYSQTAVTINMVFLLSLMLSICLATNYRIRPYLFLCQTPRVPYPSAEEKNHRKSSKTKSRGNVAAAAGTRFDERRVFVERRWYDFVICMRLIVKYLFFCNACWCNNETFILVFKPVFKKYFFVLMSDGLASHILIQVCGDEKAFHQNLIPCVLAHLIRR